MPFNTIVDNFQPSFLDDASKLNVNNLEVDKFIKEMNALTVKKMNAVCKKVSVDYEIQLMGSINKLSDKV